MIQRRDQGGWHEHAPIAVKSQKGQRAENVEVRFEATARNVHQQAGHQHLSDGDGVTRYDPAWSPKGDKIIYTSLRTGQMELFLIDVNDPTQIDQLTQGETRVESRMAAWSPDGAQLVYVVKRVGVNQIWMMNSDGTEPAQIIRSGQAFNDYLPDWSPRNDLIIFNQRCAKTFCNPYLLSASATDHSTEQGLRLPFNLLYIENIDYSPDGFYIASEGSEESLNIDVYLMTVSGGDRVRLTSGPEGDFDPAWRPAIINP